MYVLFIFKYLPGNIHWDKIFTENFPKCLCQSSGMFSACLQGHSFCE